MHYSTTLGYEKGEDGEPKIVPEEAETIRMIYSMFLDGSSYRDIAKSLAEQGRKKASGKTDWTHANVMSILKNEKYAGDALLQKTYVTDCISKKTKKNTGELPMYYVSDHHVAIIDRDTFNKAQIEITRRNSLKKASGKETNNNGQYSAKYALTERMYCAECGAAYRRTTWTAKGYKEIVWRCVSRLDNGKKYCKDSITVPEEALQEAIVRALNRFSAEDESTYLSLMKATIADAIGLNGGWDEIDLLERRVDALNKRMLDMVNASIQNGEDIDSHEEEFKELSQQIAELKERIRAIQESQSNDNYEERLAIIQQTIDRRTANPQVYDDSIVRQMIECIRVYHDGRLEIVFGGGIEMEEHLAL